MPLSKLKKVWDYCSYNVVFFIFICLLIFFFNLLPDYSTTYFGWEVGRLTQVIVLILLNGYGMIIAHDRINHGYRLPKIIPSDVVNFGIKSTIVYAIFVSFQTFLLSVTTLLFGVPIFDLHELLLHYRETIHMFFINSPEYMLMFIIIGGVVFYITTFLAEIGLARLADTKSILQAFNVKAIYKSIRIFGFRNYVREYTVIILLITILTLIKSISLHDFALDNLWEMVFGFLIFATQYLGIGAVYCEIKDAQINSEQFKESS